MIIHNSEKLACLIVGSYTKSKINTGCFIYIITLAINMLKVIKSPLKCMRSVLVTITLHLTLHRQYSHQWYDSMDPVTALQGLQSVVFDPSHLNSGPEPAVLHVLLQTLLSQLPALSQTCDEASGSLPIDWTTCNKDATAQSTIWQRAEKSLSKWCVTKVHSQGSTNNCDDCNRRCTISQYIYNHSCHHMKNYAHAHWYNCFIPTHQVT